MKSTKRIPILIVSMIYCMSLAVTSLASPIVTNSWDVDFENNAPVVLNVWRGDTRALTAQTGLTSLTNDAMFYWQSADMQSLWYSTNATVAASGDVTAVWDSGMDAGDSYYTFFFRAGGVYCPRGTIKMQGSPGAVPNDLPLPTLRIDFDLIETLNAPWATPADVATAVDTFIELDPQATPIATNALAIAQAAIKVEADKKALQLYHYGSPDITPTRADAFGFDPGTGTITSYDFALGGPAVVIPWEIGGVKVSEIGGRAFVLDDIHPLGITTLVAPKSIVRIYFMAFKDSWLLKSVSIPSVIYLGDEVFSSCVELETVVLNSAVELSGNLFVYCTKLNSISFSCNAPVEPFGIYEGSPNVTNYVVNPNATGWGDTFGDRPVVRGNSYRDEVYIDGEPVSAALATMRQWTDIATNVVYHVVVSNGHWLIKEVR